MPLGFQHTASITGTETSAMSRRSHQIIRIERNSIVAVMIEQHGRLFRRDRLAWRRYQSR
jgi:hypothetical protein